MSEHTGAAISILLPVYNLESEIAANIRRVAEVCDQFERAEIVVIDDGSTDLTREQAEKAAAPLPDTSVIGYERNRGKGAALKEGCKVATGDLVVFLDSDLDLPPEQLPAFVGALGTAGTDALVGAKQRAMTSGKYPLLRKLLSLVFSGVNQLLFRLPVAETQTGLKAFKRSALMPAVAKLQTSGYAFDLELLVRIHKAGGTISEAPVELADGAAGRVSMRTLVSMGIDTFRIWFRSLRWS